MATDERRNICSSKFLKHLLELSLHEFVVLLRLLGAHVVDLLRDGGQSLVHEQLLGQDALVRAALLQVQLQEQAVAVHRIVRKMGRKDT